MSARLARICAAALSLSACRWQLRPLPEPPQDSAVADAAPSLPQCTQAASAPVRPADPSAPFEYRAVLSRPTAADIGRGACLGDLDGDRAPELVVLRADSLAEVYDPRTLCLRSTVVVPPHARACLVDDLDGDGRPELALAHSVRFSARFREQYQGRAQDSVTVGHVEPPAAGQAQWRWRWPAQWSLGEDRHVRGVGHVLVALDLDRDGDRELAVAGTITSDERTQRAFVRAWEFTAEGCADERRCPRSAYDRDFFDALDTNDLFVVSVDDDPEPELALDLGCNGGGLFAIDRWDRAPSMLASVGQPSHGAFGDVDGDGSQDYLAAITPRCAGGADTSLRWLRPSGGSYRYFNEAITPEHRRAAQHMVAAVDVLGDARPEALACTRNSDAVGTYPVRCDLYAFDPPHIDRVWSWVEPDAHADMISRLLVGDVDGDLRDDVLIVTQSRVHLLLGR